LLSELHREFNRSVYVAYVDLKSAFDSVDREALWKAVWGVGVPETIVSLIRDLHSHTHFQVDVANSLSSPFGTHSGVRQECVLAPALFIHMYWQACTYVLNKGSKHRCRLASTDHHGGWAAVGGCRELHIPLKSAEFR